MRYIYLLLFLFVIEGTNLFASKIKTDNIAQVSASSLYNIDKTSLQDTIKAAIKNYPNLKALKIVESLSGETYISIYITENGKTILGELPKDLSKYRLFKSKSKYLNEDVGEIFAYYENKALITLSNEEINWLKKHKDTIRFTGDPSWMPFETFDKGGIYQGIVADHLKIIQKTLGIKLEYIKPTSWSDAVKMTQDGTVDMISEVVSKNIINKTMDYTTPYIETPLVVISHRDSNLKYITDLNKLKNKTIGYVKDYGYVEELKTLYPKVSFKEVKTVQDGLEKVATNQLDIMVLTLTIGSYNISKLGLSNLQIVGKLPITMKLGFGVRKDWPEFIEILNKAILSISFKEQQNIMQNWMAGSLYNEQKTSSILLTDDDRNWIKKHPKIRVHNEKSWAPYNFYEKGRARGLSIDYIKALAKQSGLVIEFISGPSWDEFMTMSKNKDIDVMMNIVKSPTRDEFLNFTEPYSELLQSIYVRKGEKTITKIEELFGKTFAVPKGFYYEKKLKEYPQINFLRLNNTLECLQAVSFGKADAMLDLTAVVNYYKEKHKINNVVMGGTLGWEEGSLPIRIGVRKDWPELVSILNKSLTVLSDNELDSIEDKWIFGNTQVKNKFISLTKEEKKWIRENKVKVGIEEWAPIIFSHGKKDFDGITGDVLRLVVEKTGLNLEVMNGLWDPLLEKFKNKELDLLPATYYTDERATYGLYSDSYYKMLDYIYVKENNNQIKSMHDLIGKRVALTKGLGSIVKIQKKFPGITIVQTRGLSDSIQRVLRGEVDALYDGQIAVEYKIQEELIVGLKGIPQKEFSATSIYFFSHIDKPILKGIINKVLKNIPIHEINKIKSKWLLEKGNEKIFDNSNSKIDDEKTWSLIITVISVFLFLLFVLLITTKFISNDFIAKSFGSFKFRIIVLIILSIIIFMLSILVNITLTNNKKEILLSTKKDLEFVLGTTQNRLDTWMSERKNFLLQMGRDRELVDATRALLKVKKDVFTLKSSEELKKVREFFEKRKKEFGSLGFFIIDKDFISIASKRDTNIGTKNLIAKYNSKLLERILDGEAVFIPPMQTDVAIKMKKENSNEHTMFFGIPIQDQEGNVLAIMTQRLDIEGKFSNIIDSGRIGQSGESYIFSKDAFMLTKSRFRNKLINIGLLKADEKEYEKIQIKNPGGSLIEGYKPKISIGQLPLTKMAKKAISLDDKITSKYSKIYSDIEGYRNYLGVEVFGAWIWYNKFGFGLTTEIDEKEALSGFYILRQNLLIITGLTLLLTVLATIMLIILGEKSTRSVQKANNELNKLLSSFDENVIASRSDLKGRITYASKAFTEISGYTLDELIGSPHSKLRHPDMPKELFKDLWNTIQNGKIWRAEVKNLKKDGGIYWIDIVITPEFDDKENIIGYSAIRNNITSKKEVEALSENLEVKVEERTSELKEEQEKFISMVSNIPGVIYRCLLDDYWTMLFISDEIENLSGYKSSDFLNNKTRTFADIMHPDDIEWTAKEVISKIEEGEKYNIEYRIITSNGDIKWVLAQGKATFDESGKIGWLDGAIFDINEQKKLQEEIKESQQRFELTIAGSGDGLWEYNAQTNENWFSPLFKEMLGYKIDELENTFDAWKECVHSDDIDFALDAFVKHIQDDIPYDISYRMIRKDGEYIWVRARAKSLRDENGKVLRTSGSVTDITNLKKAEQEIMRSQERFSTLFDSAPDSISIIKDGKYIDCNKKTLEIFGFRNSQELLDSKPSDFSPEYQENGIRSDELSVIKIQEVLNTGRTSFEWIHKRYDTGEVFDAEVILALININNESHVYSVVRDITERKKLEKQITENKLFVDTLLDSQEQIVITTDGKILKSCNKAFLELFELENMEEFTKEYDCICDKFVLDETGSFLQKYMSELSWIEYVLAHDSVTHKAVIKKAGKEYIFTVTAAVLPIGDGDLRSAVFTDITEMEEIRKNIEMILSNIMLPVLITSKKDRKILYANDYSSKQYETSVEELVGSSIDDVYTSLDQKDKILTIMKEQGYVENLEENYKTRKGKEFIGLLSVKPILYDGEDAFIGMVVDITQQKEIETEIREIHKHTRSSIEYASLIQHSLIPSNDLFQKYFDDYFIIWQPKDIVGGDIYLFEELRDENECLLMVIDCTGHGVPGAFVTMLVKAIERQVSAIIMNDIKKEVSPAWILKYFNQTMKKLLKQEDDDAISNAGFDGAILYYNKKDQIVKFSGAELALFYTEDKELKTIKGNRHSVGYKKSDANYEFKEHCIDVKEGMQFYLSTDGYFDQNGGDKGFPFGKKRFQKILEDSKDRSFVEQEEVLLNSLQEYQKEEERNDDISVVGIKIGKVSKKLIKKKVG